MKTTEHDFDIAQLKRDFRQQEPKARALSEPSFIRDAPLDDDKT